MEPGYCGMVRRLCPHDAPRCFGGEPESRSGCPSMDYGRGVFATGLKAGRPEKIAGPNARIAQRALAHVDLYGKALHR